MDVKYMCVHVRMYAGTLMCEINSCPVSKTRSDVIAKHETSHSGANLFKLWTRHMSTMDIDKATSLPMKIHSLTSASSRTYITTLSNFHIWYYSKRDNLFLQSPIQYLCYLTAPWCLLSVMFHAVTEIIKKLKIIGVTSKLMITHSHE